MKPLQSEHMFTVTVRALVVAGSKQSAADAVEDVMRAGDFPDARIDGVLDPQPVDFGADLPEACETVTPAMLEAGALALAVPVTPSAGLSNLLTRVFQDMCAARIGSPCARIDPDREKAAKRATDRLGLTR